MMRETEPSTEPLFPEGTPCEVISPEGKRMFGGFYVHHRKVVTCFAEDERPENYAHAVFHRGITDWGFPETWTLTEITPPHAIETNDAAIGDINKMRQAHPVRGIEYVGETCEEFPVVRCGECGEILRFMGDPVTPEDWNPDTDAPEHCWNCGAHIVGPVVEQ